MAAGFPVYAAILAVRHLAGRAQPATPK